MFKISISLLHTANIVISSKAAKYEGNLLLLLPSHHDIRCDILGKLNG